MQYADFTEEKKLWGIGFGRVAGLDEAGRGPLAGPVVAAAVCLAPHARFDLPRIRDSKKLSGSRRSELFKKLTKHSAVSYGVGVVSEKIIDEVNILEATRLAMHFALERLIAKNRPYRNLQSFANCGMGKKSGPVDCLLVDGNFSVYSRLPQQSIVGADARVYSCAAAGIIAKVTRDRIMRRVHEFFPAYGFDRHKGYGTALHLVQLASLGPCEIHRRTFFPVSAASGSTIAKMESI